MRGGKKMKERKKEGRVRKGELIQEKEQEEEVGGRWKQTDVERQEKGKLKE